MIGHSRSRRGRGSMAAGSVLDDMVGQRASFDKFVRNYPHVRYGTKRTIRRD